MRAVQSAAEVQHDSRPVCAALGMFDGVHLGHQHVIRQAALDARNLGGNAVVLTFHPHPLSIVHPDRAPRLLQTFSQRLDAFAKLGIDSAVAISFDHQLSQQTGETFIRNIAAQLGALRSITVGQGFHFGFQRSGDVNLLRTLGKELGFRVNAMAPIHIGDEIVSSTRIRAALRDGQLSHVSELLGRPYALAGKVVPGDRLARQLGFPTANLDVSGLELPPFGVYAVRVKFQSKDYLGALNIGVRPTVAKEPAFRFEVHLLDFDGDLYGQELEVEFIRRLRPEQKFGSLDALRGQVARDIAEVRTEPL